jgi:hypothetical protein
MSHDIDIFGVTELYDYCDDDEPRRPAPLSYYVAVDVSIDEDLRSVGCVVGLPESLHATARSTGLGVDFGGGPRVWWEQTTDHVTLALSAVPGVLEALQSEARRLWDEAEEMNTYWAEDDDALACDHAHVTDGECDECGARCSGLAEQDGGWCGDIECPLHGAGA